MKKVKNCVSGADAKQRDVKSFCGFVPQNSTILPKDAKRSEQSVFNASAELSYTKNSVYVNDVNALNYWFHE